MYRANNVEYPLGKTGWFKERANGSNSLVIISSKILIPQIKSLKRATQARNTYNEISVEEEHGIPFSISCIEI